MIINDAFRRTIEALIASSTTTDPGTRCLAEKLNALPIGYDMFVELFIRSDGTVLVVDALDPEQPVVEQRGDGKLVTALLMGLRYYPVLQTLLPERTVNDKDCATCSGSGRVFDNIYCPDCSGLGWIRSC